MPSQFDTIVYVIGMNYGRERKGKGSTDPPAFQLTLIRDAPLPRHVPCGSSRRDPEHRHGPGNMECLLNLLRHLAEIQRNASQIQLNVCNPRSRRSHEEGGKVSICSGSKGCPHACFFSSVVLRTVHTFVHQVPHARHVHQSTTLHALLRTLRAHCRCHVSGVPAREAHPSGISGEIWSRRCSCPP